MGPGVATPLPLVQHMHSQKTIFDSCPTDPRVLFSCHVWDPFLHKDIELLESVQKFAFRVCTKR